MGYLRKFCNLEGPCTPIFALGPHNHDKDGILGPKSIMVVYMGGYQYYGTFLGTLNIRCRMFNRDPKRDPNFDNRPYGPGPSGQASSPSKQILHDP